MHGDTSPGRGTSSPGRFLSAQVAEEDATAGVRAARGQRGKEGALSALPAWSPQRLQEREERTTEAPLPRGLGGPGALAAPLGGSPHPAHPAASWEARPQGRLEGVCKEFWGSPPTPHHLPLWGTQLRPGKGDCQCFLPGPKIGQLACGAGHRGSRQRGAFPKVKQKEVDAGIQLSWHWPCCPHPHFQASGSGE